MLAISCFSVRRVKLGHVLEQTYRSVSVSSRNNAVISEKRQSPSRSNHTSIQSAIDKVSAQKSSRWTAYSVLNSGTASTERHILGRAKYLQKELPVRIAHRIAAFQGLPYNVVSNPTIYRVLEMYISAFERTYEFRQIKTIEDEQAYSLMLRDLLDHHGVVVSMLAEGFSECRKYILAEDIIRQFLDRTLTSRLAIRILCEHHIALRNDKPNHVGIFKLNFSPAKLIREKSELVRKICEDKFGMSPNVIVDGHVDAEFVYVPPPLDYILVELLKNALRATVENHMDSSDAGIPPVRVTLAVNNLDFIIRISDHGGGVPHMLQKRIWDYNFTSEKTPDPHSGNRGLFGEVMDPLGGGGATNSRMHGYGFGLPMSRAYAEFLGGKLTMQTMQGLGTDVYLRLRRITETDESFRV
ncbi:3-methyl-2-oxobutanoate dehydrogenase [lipoamide] kinase, mitochondrial-like [Mya arenaria]|uniref:3-methyl-2-oxobutanoate dehydrogenase [lipoamide] kinase, mitochondrial-like n=1 Tax=Mya arenaria TaxID=6604 RepID=UPI0022E75270|nr:3-methyl-2-oxobutanoate dehydrogenase [lipoamide] kinase, mitochondrial-like [Mya arenaria]